MSILSDVQVERIQKQEVAQCGMRCKDGKVCVKSLCHSGKHLSGDCPACGVNPARPSRDRRCKECVVSAHRQKKYGVTATDIKRMKRQQYGLCLWCLQHLGKKFAIDHNHETEQVRGLMHIACNTQAGMVEKWLALSEEERERRTKVLIVT